MIRRDWRRCQAGATAVELALVLPLFIAMVFGIFNYGWALYCGGEVRNAVENASRLLIVDPDTSLEDIQAAVAGRLTGASIDDVTLTMATETVGATTHVARVSWTYAYVVETPFIDQTILTFDSSIVTPLRE
jgi:Flp pilus assembly protein TadG